MSVDSPSPELRLSLDSSARLHDSGRTIIGGSPTRILKLSAAGATAVASWLAGESVAMTGSTKVLADRLLAAGVMHPTWSASPFTGADVTVVIPVKGDEVGLARTVESVLAMDEPVAGIVIVDDGSESAVMRAPSWPEHVRLVRQETNMGPAAARNVALPEVGTELVLFVDADVTVTDDLVSPLLAQLADTRVVAVAPQVRSDETDDSVLGRYEQLHSPLDLGSDPANVRPRARVSYVPSACLLMRTEAAGFDAALRYGEDVDMVWRLVADGLVVRYEPAATVMHRPRPSVTSFVKQRFGYASASAPLAKRHPGAVVPVVMSAWSAAAWSLAALGHPVIGVAVAAGSTARLPSKLGDLPDRNRRAFELAGRGHLGAGRQLANGVTRHWWPLTAVAALVSPRARMVGAAAAIVPSAIDWVKKRPPLDPARYIGLRALDDVSYGAGLWASCWRHRTVAPLIPDFGRSSSASRLFSLAGGERPSAAQATVEGDHR